VLSYVSQERAPFTEFELDHLQQTVFLAVNVVNHIVRNTADIELEAPSTALDSEAASALPQDMLGRFTEITHTLAQIHGSLESRYFQLN
jgi:hypothetical protein